MDGNEAFIFHLTNEEVFFTSQYVWVYCRHTTSGGAVSWDAVYVFYYAKCGKCMKAYVDFYILIYLPRYYMQIYVPRHMHLNIFASVLHVYVLFLYVYVYVRMFMYVWFDVRALSPYMWSSVRVDPDTYTTCYKGNVNYTRYFTLPIYGLVTFTLTYMLGFCDILTMNTLRLLS